MCFNQKAYPIEIDIMWSQIQSTHTSTLNFKPLYSPDELRYMKVIQQLPTRRLL